MITYTEGDGSREPFENFLRCQLGSFVLFLLLFVCFVIELSLISQPLKWVPWDFMPSVENENEEERVCVLDSADGLETKL